MNYWTVQVVLSKAVKTVSTVDMQNERNEPDTCNSMAWQDQSRNTRGNELVVRGPAGAAADRHLLDHLGHV